LDQQNALSENNVSYFEQPIKLGGQAFVSRMLAIGPATYLLCSPTGKDDAISPTNACAAVEEKQRQLRHKP
jgi:hypothetical protein